MPAVTRELSIVYGATTIGGTSDSELLHAVYSKNVDQDRGSLVFDFVMRATSEANFEARTSALETAFRTPRQRLRVIQGAETLHDWNDATNTGFNHEPSLDALEDEEFASGRSRRYRVSIRFDLPADVYAQAGRRRGREVVEYTPGRRRSLILTGEWTAIPGGPASATAQYQANIAAYAATITGGLGGTWELTSERFDRDEEDKILTYNVRFEELIFNQASGVLNDPDLVEQTLRVRSVRERPGDSPGKDAARLLRVSVTYDVWVDKDRTTDLVSKYEGTVRPWLIQHALERVNASDGALVEEAPEYDGPENRISVGMQLLVTDGGSVLEYRRTDEIDDRDFGTVFVPAWEGGPYDNYEYQGPALRFLTISEQIRELAGGGGGGGAGRRFGVGIVGGRGAGPVGAVFGGGGPGNVGIGVGDLLGARGPGENLGGNDGDAGFVDPNAGAGGAGPRWVPVSDRNARTPLRLGTDDQGFLIVERQQVRVFRWSRKVTGGRPPAQGGPGEVITEAGGGGPVLGAAQ